MNIIFGDHLDKISPTHTVLELDTFRLMPSQKVVTSYCVVGAIPLAEFPQIENNKRIHQKLMEHYRQQDWQFCQTAIHALTGCWNGELDSFYQHLSDRIQHLDANPPDANWDGYLVKQA